MLLKDFLKEGTSRLEGIYPEAEARNIMLLLCEKRIGTKSYTHIIEPEYSVKDKDSAVLVADLERLVRGEPIQYVLGEAEFCGLVFKVDRNVLIPRQETELLVRRVIDAASRIQRLRSPFGKSSAPARVLDLCTGSGCIAWSTALYVPGCEVVATDISEGALMVAIGQDFNGKIRETGAVRPTFVRSDVLDTEQPFDHGKFDIIVSNPPYVRESEKQYMRVNVLDYEPSMALFVPDDDPLVFYRAIARWSSRFLAPDGAGMIEINEGLGSETEDVVNAERFASTEIVKDLFNKNRFIVYSKQGLR